MENQAYKRLEKIANLMDARFTVPGTNFKFGLDAIIGLLPGGGDIIGAIIALLVSLEGFRITRSPSLLARMLINVAIDSLAGLVPVLGDLVDAGYKANIRNVDLVRKHLNIDEVEAVLELPAPAEEKQTNWVTWLAAAVAVMVAIVLWRHPKAVEILSKPLSLLGS